MTTPTVAPVVVLGIGNELLGDDGLGVAVARRLARLDLPGVEVLDGGTLGLMLLPYLAGREALLVLDAVAGDRPGDTVVLHDAEVRRGHGIRATAHDVGLIDALAAAELSGCAPERIALVGAVAESVTERWGLSPLLAAKVDELAAIAVDLLTRWGYPPCMKQD